ncbi:DUF1697 domain-containing protein [Paenibacillus sp. MER TA 81-3]|uniref:DUF1697 domain-containing protein n=1 Tax=Paenibacillus sp. MER TA 81-3 TaxID=2939573 RepID=UPI00203B7336|nr:DUF1697 domain-containing protein [Paenibacillus sp. MER TA 81-3]MCM3337494.1 DUF1697 domain-containing protein [Paenibacillus sp. MER TA 81-3]
MNKYVALLRGINVSGQKIIKMDALKSIFEALAFQNVKTYIQSGNVIFEASATEPELLAESIEKQLRVELGYEITVVVKTLSELEEVIQHNPFTENEASEGKLYVSFLSKEPVAEDLTALLSVQNGVDEIRALEREVYILCRQGYGKSQFSNNFIEKKLRMPATTRNWQTVNKLANM